jgi:hypothetical protein
VPLTRLMELYEELEDVLWDLGEGLLGSNLLLEGSSSGGRLVLKVGSSSRKVGKRLLACRGIEQEMQVAQSAKAFASEFRG